MTNEWQGVDAWLQMAKELLSVEEVSVVEKIVAWAKDQGLKHRGQGDSSHAAGVVYMPIIPSIDWDPVPFNVSLGYRRVALEGSSIHGKGRRPYGDDAAFERLLDQVKSIEGVSKHKDTYPDISIEALADDETFDRYFAMMSDVVDQVRKRNLGDVIA